MSLSHRAVATLALAVSVGGCRPADPPRPDTRPAAAAPEAAAPEVPATQPAASRFAPPADGKLTPKQVDLYVATQKRAAEILGRSQADPQALTADQVIAIATTDERAARDLGYDLDEYRWIKARVLESQPIPAGEGQEVLTQIAAAAGHGVQKLGNAAPRAGADDVARAHNRQLLDGAR